MVSNRRLFHEATGDLSHVRNVASHCKRLRSYRIVETEERGGCILEFPVEPSAADMSESGRADKDALHPTASRIEVGPPASDPTIANKLEAKDRRYIQFGTPSYVS